MAKKHSRTGKLFTIIFVLLVAVCLLLTASSYGFLPDGFPSWETVFGKSEHAAEDVFANSCKAAENDNTAAVYFIDCGQGDCEAIVSNGTLTVIDSGPSKSANSTLSYIKSLGFSKIDNLVLTHAHEDHIGGAKQLIENFQIGAIYMSKPKSGTEPNTEV